MRTRRDACEHHAAVARATLAAGNALESARRTARGGSYGPVRVVCLRPALGRGVAGGPCQRWVVTCGHARQLASIDLYRVTGAARTQAGADKDDDGSARHRS